MPGECQVSYYVRNYGIDTYFQKPRVLSFLDAFINQLQRLLKILPVNGILNLLVPPIEHGVIGGHGGGGWISVEGIGIGKRQARMLRDSAQHTGCGEDDMSRR